MQFLHRSLVVPWSRERERGCIRDHALSRPECRIPFFLLLRPPCLSRAESSPMARSSPFTIVIPPNHVVHRVNLTLVFLVLLIPVVHQGIVLFYQAVVI